MLKSPLQEFRQRRKCEDHAEPHREKKSPIDFSPKFFDLKL